MVSSSHLGLVVRHGVALFFGPFGQDHERVPGNVRKLKGKSPVEQHDEHTVDPLEDGGGVLEDEALLAKENPAEDKSDESQQRHGDPQMSRLVLSLRFGQSVGKSRLQTHEQHTGGERDSSSNVVQHFGVVHLEVSHHDESSRTDPARGQSRRVQETVLVLLNHMSITKQADHHHHEGASAADEAEETTLGWHRSTFTYEWYVIQ